VCFLLLDVLKYGLVKTKFWTESDAQNAGDGISGVKISISIKKSMANDEQEHRQSTWRKEYQTRETN
jgi:hypothetical protein